MRADQRSDPFDPSSPSFGAAPSSSATDHVPHPGLARAWANSEQRGQPAGWPPASAGQPPNMHLGHPGTPTAQHPFAHHPFGAGAGCGCAAARLFLPRSGRCDRRNITHFPYTMPTAQACASRYSPHTQELHGHALAAVNTGGAMFHPAGSAACLAGAYSGVNSLLGQLHAERVAAGERPHIHDHIATSSTPSTLPSTAPPRPPRPAPRGLQPSRSLVWQARAALGTKGSPTIRKTTRCRVQVRPERE